MARSLLKELENEPESVFPMLHCRIDIAGNGVFPIIFEPI
jgi:hypothetical protein